MALKAPVATRLDVIERMHRDVLVLAVLALGGQIVHRKPFLPSVGLGSDIVGKLSNIPAWAVPVVVYTPGRGWWIVESNAADRDTVDDTWEAFIDRALTAVFAAVLGEIGVQCPTFATALDLWRENKADDTALPTLLMTWCMATGHERNRLEELLEFEIEKPERRYDDDYGDYDDE